MIKIRFTLFLFLIFSHLSICPTFADSRVNALKGGAVEWNYVIYVNGRNSLERMAQRTLREIGKIPKPLGANVIIEYADFQSEQISRLFLDSNTSTKDYYLKTIERLPMRDMGHPDTLKDFLYWVKNNFNSRHTAVIIWDHGFGWHGPQPFDISIDDSTGNLITTEKMAQVFLDYKKDFGDIDLVGFDACLMSSIEIAFEIQESVKFMVASVDNERGEGWPHEQIIPRLSLISSPANLASIIVEQYSHFYKYDSSATLAAIHLVELDDILPVIAEFYRAFSNLESSEREKLVHSVRAFGWGDYRDLGQMLIKMRPENTSLWSDLSLKIIPAKFPQQVEVTSHLSFWLKTDSNTDEEVKRYKGLKYFKKIDSLIQNGQMMMIKGSFERTKLETSN